MTKEPQYDKGGWLPSGPTLMTIDPDEHIVTIDPSGAPLCRRADHVGHECEDAWWDVHMNVWRKIKRT